MTAVIYAEKVVRGQTENILKGRCNGGRGTFGYTLDLERKFHIDSLTSPFVLESFKKYNEGSTMKEIRDWLNEKGVKNQRGGLMAFNTIQHMLNNRRYIGELKFRDVVVPDAIPPIISLELFEDVQEKIAKNKKAPARRKAEDDYLLTTKPFCGYCGALMFGESGTSRTGEVHRYYKCATAKKPKVTEEFIRFWLLRFRKLDMSLKDQRQALVDTFINAIYLYDDKVLITFNYKEGTQTVTFGEATEVAFEGNGSDLDCFAALFNGSFQKAAVFLLPVVLLETFYQRIRGLEQQLLQSSDPEKPLSQSLSALTERLYEGQH